MLRLALARGARCSERGLYTAACRQWQPRGMQLQLSRAFADARTPDKVVFPGTQSDTVAGVPQPPILPSEKLDPSATDVPPNAQVKVPPTPSEVNATQPVSRPAPIKTPASIPTPTPKRRPRRFRNFLLTLLFLTGLYGGSVYFALTNDNFYDFFTEYIPFGEDAVAYFEEREFRKRFPTKELHSKNWPQMRGENKVTIGRSSGLSPRVASSKKESDLGANGKHTSALEDKKPAAGPADAVKAVAATSSQLVDSGKEKVQEVASKAASTVQSAASKPAAPAVDHINIPNADEPVVQHLVKMINNIITAVNASPEAGNYSPTINTAKDDLNQIISQISTLKSQAEQNAESKIKDAHSEFDTAAKELVRRLEQEMREQEAKWREEYESERERLSQSYQDKLAAELAAVQRVADEKTRKSLLEQEIALQNKFVGSVKSHVEEERNGRLAKLDDLSATVTELEKLTTQWDEIVDATQRSQHLHIGLESLRNAVLNSEHPTPFVDELVALKQVGGDDVVVNAAIASINPAAYQRGLPSPAAIIDRFRRVASEVRKASLLPEDAGVASHAASAVLSKLMFAKKSERGLPEGEDVEATLSRTEVLLEEGDLESAAREMNGLKGWAGVLSRDWVSETRRVLEVRQAIDVIAIEARLQSLLVE